MPFTPRVVLVTASSLEEARSLAKGLLEKKLAACVNLLPGVESHYWWQGNLESGTEVQMLIKTSAENFEAVAGQITQNHSYQCPEIVAVAPQEISPAFRSWWAAELGATDVG